jgi:steroid 5-alpha reductase family enzyme
MNLLQTYLILLGSIVGFEIIVFCISRLIGKRNDFADVAWGIGFILLAVVTFCCHHSPSLLWRQLLPVILVSIWGLRLSTHIFRRFIRNKQGDARYHELATKWGSHVELRSFLDVFLSQGILTILVSTPVILAVSSTPKNTMLIIIGAAIWLVGFFFESVGDAQLTRFLANPVNKGQLMTAGLWRYTRHPNYFGEITQWWGLFVIGLSAAYGWIGVIGALAITVLVTKISGIPLLEAHYKGRSDWEAYARQTSTLIPRLPHKP